MKKFPDIFIIIIVLLLLVIGVTTIYNALALYRTNSTGGFFFNYLAIIGLSIAACIVCIFVDLSFVERIAPYVALGILIALVVVLVPFIGRKVGGSRRWIPFIMFTIQPSEAAKLGLVAYLAALFTRKGEKMTMFSKGFLPPFIVSILFAFFIMLEPDIGTALLIIAVVFGMFFFAGTPVVYLVSTALVSLPLFYLLISGKAYVWYRIVGFLNPWDRKSAEGYHLVQSFKSFALGGFTGSSMEGLLERTVSLPAATTDFIFAVIAQKAGFLGCTAVVLLFLAFLIRGLHVVKHTEDTFRQNLAFGIVFMIVVQAFLNILVVVGLVPTTGMTLPFISYGNNSLVITMAMVGLLLNISRTASETEQ
ncbi:MAG: cell division protein FtsW [Spirochaetes bacterium]|nr:cell division protein FtsW [Spirochaetota bacterium]